MIHHGPEFIAVLGRGIERAGKKGRWKPTRYIERFTDQDWHPGVRVQGISADSPDKQIVIGGANANVIAACQLVQEFWCEGKTPKMVAFVCGRPNYLKDEPDDLTGAKIDRDEFERRLNVSSFKVTPKVEVIACGDRNKNTKDDILTILSLAKDRGFRKVVIVTVLVHIQRSKEFIKLIRREHPELRKTHVVFFASEHVLSRRHRLYRKMLFPALHSRAYEHTLEREKRGMNLLREGKYVSLQETKR